MTTKQIKNNYHDSTSTSTMYDSTMIVDRCEM